MLDGDHDAHSVPVRTTPGAFTNATCVKVTPSVERSILNPLSLFELSVQDRVIWVELATVAGEVFVELGTHCREHRRFASLELTVECASHAVELRVEHPAVREL